MNKIRNDHDGYSAEETAERMERGIRRFLNTPPQPRGKNPKSVSPKPKERAESRKRVHKEMISKIKPD
jgi:hypothetical protein